MSEITRTDDVTDGSVTIAARIDVADQLKSDRDVIDGLEIAMREALEVITGAPDPKVGKLRWLRTGRNLWGAIKAFALLVVLVCLVVAMLRILLLAIAGVWGLLP